MKYVLVISLLCFSLFKDVPQSRVSATEWFDQYGAISWPEERTRLDGFAIYLLKNREMIGYVFVCLDKPLSAVKDRKRKVNQISKYLTGTRQVPSSRIKIVDRGKCEETDIILQPFDRKMETLEFPK